MFYPYLLFWFIVGSVCVEGTLNWSSVNNLNGECRKKLLEGTSTTKSPSRKNLTLSDIRRPKSSDWRAEMAALANAAPEIDRKTFYCIFTNLGFVDSKGNVVWKSLDGDVNCNEVCKRYLADCITDTDYFDAHTKAFMNANCLYAAVWKVIGFV